MLWSRPCALLVVGVSRRNCLQAPSGAAHLWVLSGAGKAPVAKDRHSSMWVVPNEGKHIAFWASGLAPSDKKKQKKCKHLLGWEEKFALLRAFKRAHGHCRVPPGYVVGGVKLAGWAATQRKEFIKFCLGLGSSIINEKRIHRLERVGFEWDLDERKQFLPMYLPVFGYGGETLTYATCAAV